MFLLVCTSIGFMGAVAIGGLVMAKTRRERRLQRQEKMIRTLHTSMEDHQLGTGRIQ